MSAPRREGKGLREGSTTAKALGTSMRQGSGWTGPSREEGSKSMGANMHQGTGWVKRTGKVQDVAQRMHQGSIKE